MAYQLRTGKTQEIAIEFDNTTTVFKVRPQTVGETANLQSAVRKIGEKNWTLQKAIPHILPLIVGWDVQDEYGKEAALTIDNLNALPAGIIDSLTSELAGIGFLGAKPKTVATE